MFIYTSFYSPIVDNIILSSDHPVYLDDLIEEVSDIIGYEIEEMEPRVKRYLKESESKYVRFIYKGEKAVTSVDYFSNEKDEISIILRLLRLAGCPIRLRDLSESLNSFVNVISDKTNDKNHDYERYDFFDWCSKFPAISFLCRYRKNNEDVLLKEISEFRYISLSDQYDSKKFAKWPNTADGLEILKFLNQYEGSTVLECCNNNTYISAFEAFYKKHLSNLNIQKVEDFKDDTINKLLGDKFHGYDRSFYNKYLQYIDFLVERNKKPTQVTNRFLDNWLIKKSYKVNLLLIFLCYGNIHYLNSIVYEQNRAERLRKEKEKDTGKKRKTAKKKKKQ